MKSLIITAGILAALVVALAVTAPPDKYVRTETQELGPVLSARQCNKSKYSLRCNVTTETASWRTDVTDWPGDHLQTGDVISIETRYYENRWEQWLCSNGACRSSVVCFSIMPCWKEK